jgi:hypothetical protein
MSASPVIYRPCYATREEVKRAADFQYSAYANSRIDRNIQSGSDNIEDITNRRFYPEDDTRKFDYPNNSYAPPWRLWFDGNEIAVSPLVSLKSANGTVTIPSSSYFLEPVWGPPFTRVSLNRSTSAIFGGGSTPQLDIWVQGTFGYWAYSDVVSSVVGAINSSVAQIQAANGSAVGVGDWALVETERLIIADKSMIDTTVPFSGLTTASASDNVLAVPDGTVFSPGETLGIDAERCLILDITGNNLVLKRAWDGTTLATHTSGTIYADRLLSVIRGALGTTAVAHTGGVALARGRVPAEVKELAIAEAIVDMTQESSAFSSPGQVRESAAGIGLGDLRDRVCSAYGRQQRVRAI